MGNNNNRSHLFDRLKAPVDRESFWEELVDRPDFPKPKKKNRGFLFFFLAVGFIIGSIMTYHFIQLESSSQSAAPKTEEKFSKGKISKQTSVKLSQESEVNEIEDHIEKSARNSSENKTAGTEKPRVVQPINAGTNSITQTISPEEPEASAEQKRNTIQRSDVPHLPLVKPKIETINKVNLEKQFNWEDQVKPVETLEIFASIDEVNDVEVVRQVATFKRIPQHMAFVEYTRMPEVLSPAAEIEIKKVTKNRNELSVAVYGTFALDKWSASNHDGRLQPFNLNALQFQSKESSLTNLGTIGVAAALQYKIRNYVIGAEAAWSNTQLRADYIVNQVTFELNKEPDGALFEQHITKFEEEGRKNIRLLDATLFVGRSFAVKSIYIIPVVGVGLNVSQDAPAISNEVNVDGYNGDFLNQNARQNHYFIGRLSLERQIANSIYLSAGLEIQSKRFFVNSEAGLKQDNTPVEARIGLRHVLRS